MGLTDDPSDPRLTRGSDVEPKPQAEVYLVLSPEETAKGFVRPLRLFYWHTVCGQVTKMAYAIAETYAREPAFYGATYCATCMMHKPGGANGEFHWCVDGQEQSPDNPKVGT